MDPALSQAVASLIGAVTTSLLIIVAFYFGPSARSKRERNAELDDLKQQIEVNKLQKVIDDQTPTEPKE